MSVLINDNGTLRRIDASDFDQLSVADTEGILGGTPGATTDGQTLVDQLAADDVQAQTDIGQIKTDLSDQQGEIEAILNVYGAKNFARTKGQTSTVRGVTYTANADGTYTPSNTAASGGNSWYNIWISGYTIPAGSYYIGDASGAGFVDGHRNSIRLSDNTYVTPNTVVTLTDSLQIVEWSLGVVDGTTAEQRDFKPVIIDSRILDRSFTAPAMTNRELTPQIIYNQNNICVCKQGKIVIAQFNGAKPSDIAALNFANMGAKPAFYVSTFQCRCDAKPTTIEINTNGTVLNVGYYASYGATYTDLTSDSSKSVHGSICFIAE